MLGVFPLTFSRHSMLSLRAAAAQFFSHRDFRRKLNQIETDAGKGYLISPSLLQVTVLYQFPVAISASTCPT